MEFFRVTANPNLAQQRLRYPVVMEMDIVTALDAQVCRLHQDSNSLTCKSLNAHGIASISITKDTKNGKCTNTLRSVHGLKYNCMLCMYLCILDIHVVQYRVGEGKHSVWTLYSIGYSKNLPQHPRRSLWQNASKSPKSARDKWHSETRWSFQQEQGTPQKHQARVTWHTVTLYSLPYYSWNKRASKNPMEPLARTLQLLHSYISFIPRSHLPNDHHSSSQIVARTHNLHGHLKLFGSELVSHILLDLVGLCISTSRMENTL